MASSSTRDADVLIAGAGPTGLVLALWLARLGARVRIIDKTPEPATTSRAVAVQARTLELYAQIGLADAVVARGRPAIAANLWVAGRQVARARFGDIGAGVSPYPYALIFPQDEHERLLVDRLRADGVAVERETELLDFEEQNGGVRARLRRRDGAVDICEAAYLTGCDGAHSVVRDQLSIGFRGGTYEHVFYVADVHAAGPAMNGELHVALDSSDFLVVFPLTAMGSARLIGTVRAGAAGPLEGGPDTLSWDDVGKRVLGWLDIEVARVNWFSTYRVHHRVADRFRRGRAFLLGDAAHIHSPVGGQGLNTGIGDAVNLAWKLAAVLRQAADPVVLETYETERIAFARRLVATTDRAFTAVTSSGAIARAIRLRVVPSVVPAVFGLPAARRLMFRTISQTAVTYRGSALSEGRAGSVHGGDRLPWVTTGEGADNFVPLQSLEWQLHVYGDASDDVRSVCEQRHLRLLVFAWNAAVGDSGIERDALYLVRPDGYVGLAASAAGAAKLTAYLDARHVSISRSRRRWGQIPRKGVRAPG